MKGGAAAVAMSRDLAQELGQLRREGDSFLFPSITDTSEKEHRVDIYLGRIFCTCRGFVEHKRCYHSDKVRDYMTTIEPRALVPSGPTQMPDIWRSPQQLESRLKDMAAERAVVQNFLKEVMVKDEDYGIIPGTGDKPSLYKQGAEKLAEFYGFFPKIVEKSEQSDPETGHCRYVMQVGLFDRGTGVQVAEHIGECSTRESKYMYRWVYADKLPPEYEPIKATLKKRGGKTKNGGTWVQYRLENDDLHSQWNTILKMAYKRAYVGAVLQATRSGGVFMHSAADVESWAAEGEFRYIDEDDNDPLGGAEVPTNVDRETGEILEHEAPRQGERNRERRDESPSGPPAASSPEGPLATDEQLAKVAEWAEAIKAKGKAAIEAVDAARKAEWPYAVVDGKFSAARLTEAHCADYIEVLRDAAEAKPAVQEALV